MLAVVSAAIVLFTFTANAQSVSGGSAKGKASVCKEIDDNWKCVGGSAEWQADQPFNVLFENPTPVGVNFIGIVIHQQDADGKDVKFIEEYQQDMGEANRKYATIGTELKLTAGTYSIYIIAWDKRETHDHNGNFKDYFAKTKLIVR